MSKKAGSDFCLTQKQAIKEAKALLAKPLLSHELARKLLKLPNLLISEHEHGQLLQDIKVDKIASEIGLIKGIVLKFDPNIVKID